MTDLFAGPWAPLYIVLAAIFGLLIAASLISVALQHRRPGARYLELRVRIGTWWWIVGLFGLALMLHPKGAIILMALISFLAFKEFLSLSPTRRADHMVLLWAYVAIPLQYWWVWIGWYGMFIVFIPVYLFLLLPTRMVLIGDTRGFLRSAAILHWGLMTTVFSLSHLAFLINLSSQAGKWLHTGATNLLFLLLLTELNDVAQYVWGKQLGRHKVIPKVSPNKTREGLVGGVLTTTLLSWLLAPILTPLTAMESIWVGTLIGLAGFIGDVVMSALKRDVGVKDSGAMLPGHGGILDRIDSLTYTAPIFFHVLFYLHY